MKTAEEGGMPYLAKVLAVVDANDGAGHLGDNDHVPQVGLDDLGLLILGRLLLGLAQLLDQSHRLALQAAGEAPASAAVHQLHQLVATGKEERRLGAALLIFPNPTYLGMSRSWSKSTPR